MSFLAPLFFIGLAAVAIPVLVHLIQRERKEVIEFPSLMFLRRIPYQSVERRRIHNWLLLLMRAAAMALLVAAFSRPFMTRGPLQAATTRSGAREVVILLDRSASMGYGDHWERARGEARKVVQGLGSEDRATLVLFGKGVEERVRATSDRSQLESALKEATVSSDGTRYAPALRFAQSKLTQSALPRKEVVLISDFQKTGWERPEEIHMPEGATVTPISVAEYETSGLSVASVAFQRASFSGEERVTITAGMTNRGAAAFSNLPVRLEIDGRQVDTRPVTIGPNASGSVTFPPVTVAQPNVRGTIHAGSDALPKDNVFHFVLSPSRPVSVLLIQPDGAGALSSLYLTTALSISTAPPFKVDVVPVSRMSPAQLERRSVVILNDTSALSSQADGLLKRFVEEGGGLFVAVAERTPWSGSGDASLLPGKPGSPVDRLSGGVSGTLGFLDYSHPIFDDFKDPRSGNFTDARFYKYRSLSPASTDIVLARFDDGGVAMAERRVGSGRVIAWTSTLDTSWSNFANRPMFPVIVPQILRYLARYEEPEAWHTVGRMLDITRPLGAIVREGTTGTGTAPRKASAVVVSPNGAQVTLGEGGAPAIELAEQGFYSVRLQGTGDRRPYEVAVNLDPAESDLAPLSPNDFMATVAGRAAVTPTGQSLERPELTPQEIEKSQAVWWFLLFAGAVMLLGESVLANRLSRRFART